MSKGAWLEALVWWAYGAIAVTCVCGIIYLDVQQNYRQNGNDPQMQLAEDAAAKIASGTEADQAIPVGKVDIRASLAPWMDFYNNAGVPIVSEGELNGAPPAFPPGLLDATTWRGPETSTDGNGQKEVYVTWQAADGTRDALVIVQVNSPNGMGYVVAGRNIRELESRVSRLTLNTFIGWLATLVVLFVASFVGRGLLKR